MRLPWKTLWPQATFHGAEVAVDGLPAVAVVGCNVPVSPVVPASIYDHTVIRRVDCIARLTVNVDGGVVGGWGIIKAGEIVMVGWPDERSHTDGTISDRPTSARS